MEQYETIIIIDNYDHQISAVHVYRELIEWQIGGRSDSADVDYDWQRKVLRHRGKVSSDPNLGLYIPCQGKSLSYNRSIGSAGK